MRRRRSRVSLSILYLIISFFFFNLSKQLYSFKKGRGHNDIRKQVSSPVPECEFFRTVWLIKKNYRALYQKFSHLLTKRNMIMKKITIIDL